jgi:hypothetical protein
MTRLIPLLKASWRNYISPPGISVADGATINLDGTYHFPVRSGTYDAATTETKIQFDGLVQFLGHCDPVPFTRPCLLDLTLRNPRIELTAAHATLYAEAASRPITGGEVSAWKEIELASLDIEKIAPAIAGNTTTWSALPALLTAAGSDVFTYPPNTVLDPLTFSYAGPGGKPAGETWTAPSTPRYDSRDLGSEQHLQRLIPGFTATQLIGVTGAGGVRMLDRTTLTSSAMGLIEAPLTPASVAIDPVTKTVFGGGDNGFGRLWATQWDGTAFSATQLLTDPAEWKGLIAGGGVWDATNNRYLVARYSTNTGTDAELWQVTRVGTTWTPSRIGPIVGVTGKPITSYPTAMALVQDGTATAPKRLIATLRGGQPIQLYVDVAGGRAVAEPLPEATGVTATSMSIAAGGIYFTGASVWWLPYTLVGTTVRMQATGPGAPLVVPGMVADAARTTVDPATNTLYTTATAATQIARIESGVLRHVFTMPDNPLLGSGSLLPGVVDGRLVTSFAVSLNKSNRSYGYVDASPAVTRQPTDTAVPLPTGTTSATARFTVGAGGDPAPAVRWQSRMPGGTWADVAGGTAATLETPVTVADASRQYRAILTNAAGSLATDAARVDVQTPPTITLQPTATTVTTGSDAVLEVLPGGNPYPAIQWQMRVGGVWANIEDGTAGRLVIPDAQAALAGTEFRARLRNVVDTIYSQTVKVTVVPPVSGPVSVTGGGLDWGVKASFRSYILGPIAGGSYTTAVGATKNGDGTIHFPVTGGRHDDADGTTTATLGGSVTFIGHDDAYGAGSGPALVVTIANPKVVIDGDHGTLIADVSSKPNVAGAAVVSYPGVELADLAVPAASTSTADGLAWTTIPSTLTAAGVAPFASFYAAGTVLDPLTLAITLGDPITEDPTEDPGTGSGGGGAAGGGGGGSSTPTQTTTDPVTTPVAGDAPSQTPAPVAAANPPAPPAGGPAVKAGAKQARLGTSRAVSVASVACAAGPCRVVVPKSVRVRIGGELFTVKVSAPATLKTGQTASVRIVLPKAALQKLRGHRASVKVRVVVLAGDERAVATVKPTIAA